MKNLSYLKYCFSGLLVASLGAAALASEVGAVTLDHRYIFDSNYTDAVGSSNGVATTSGTYTEAPSFVTDSPTGATGVTSALSLGASADSLKSGFSLDGSVINTTEGSISLWIKADNGATTSAADFILAGGSGPGTGTSGLFAFFSGTKLNVAAGGNDTTNTSTTLSTVTDWYHVAMTWEADFNGTYGRVTLYLNGTVVGSAYMPLDNLNLGASTLKVGNYSLTDSSSNLANQYSGLLYDLQVYSGVLSSEEVTTLYNNPGTAIPEAGSSALLVGVMGLCYLMTKRLRRRA